MRTSASINELTNAVIAAALEVHKTIGPGLLESAYEECLAFELATRSIPFVRQAPLPILYKSNLLDCGYRLDFVVAERLVLELKAVAAIEPIHEAQLLTYLRLSACPVGLLINFNVPLLKNGIVRRVLALKEDSGNQNSAPSASLW